MYDRTVLSTILALALLGGCDGVLVGGDSDAKEPDDSQILDTADGRSPAPESTVPPAQYDGAAAPDSGAAAPDSGPTAPDSGPLVPDDGQRGHDSGAPICPGVCRHVSTQGSDSNPCTASAPCRTIQHAVNMAQAGDTVLVSAGTYKELVDIGSPGTKSGWLTLKAYPGHQVIIDAAGLTIKDWWKGAVSIDDVSYVRVQGFRVMHSAFWGIIVNRSHHIEVRDNQTYDTHLSGIGVNKSKNVIVDNNDIELAVNGGTQECITISTSDQVEVTNNHVRNDGAGTNGGEGIDVKDGSSNVLVRGNHIHDLDELGIYVDAWDKHTHDIVVERNLVHDCARDRLIWF